MKSAKEKATTLTADRDIFGRLLIVAKARDVNLKDVLGYELSYVLYALAHSDGTLRLNVKSELLAELETKVEALPTLPLDEEPLPAAHTIDAIAMVQMVKPGGMVQKHLENCLTSTMASYQHRWGTLAATGYMWASTTVTVPLQ